MRTLAAALLSLVCLVAAALPGGGATAADVDDALRRLDGELRRRPFYIEQRQRSIDSLRAECEREGGPSLAMLAHAYAGFNNDSALFYLRMAENRSRGAQLQEARLHIASLLPLAGLFREAENKLAQVDTTLLSAEQMEAYYDHARQMYSYLAAFYERYPDLHTTYSTRAMEMQQRLLERLTPGSDEYLYNAGELEFLHGDNSRARIILNELLARPGIDNTTRARATNHLSAIAREEGDTLTQKFYLAESAIADMRAATREVASLQELGAELYAAGDIDRAYAYLSTALANAVECAAEMRMLESARSLPYIEQAYAGRTAASRRNALWAVAVMGLLVIVLIATLLFLRHEMLRMRRLQRRLSEANHSKEVYISQFLSLCSVYMDKLKQFSKLVTRKIGAGQVEDLYRMAKNGKFVEEESREFFEVFDNAFLHMYPTFVAGVNALLRPDEQIELPSPGRLNTDLRILAFMRLGIEDSSSIAQVLNYSLNTIYTYRNRMKARAINRDTFEADVMKIS
ncbi:MAG: hypothetical protein K2L21_03465 [Muribaculaceae bacterium]|nr:hypothetical protein [Muribaculaceae bacterium]